MSHLGPGEGTHHGLAERPSRRVVAAITAIGLSAAVPWCGGGYMPVLMVALLALAVFGGIGALLAAAVLLETRQKNKHQA